MAASDIPCQILTFKYRLLPNRKQHAALIAILEAQRQLYNAALQERIDCYKKTGKGRSLYDQQKALTELRQEDEFSALPACLQRWTLKRLNDAYAAFFRRVKQGGKAGFPRFRGKGWWKAFGFDEFSGIRLDGQRIRFKGLPGGLRVHMHRPLPDGVTIKAAVFRRDLKGWFVCLQCAVPITTKKHRGRAVGIDVGLNTLAALSTGELIPNPRPARAHEKEKRRRQRHVERCERGTAGQRKARKQVARLEEKIANIRRTGLHQESARLTRIYGTIAVEDLKIKNMVKSRMAKSIHDAGWGIFINMLGYKAARANGRLIKVDPRGTSQTCNGCGEKVPKGLSVRVHDCPHCGLVIDRNVNAAKMILARAVTGPGLPKKSRSGGLVARNINSLEGSG